MLNVYCSTWLPLLLLRLLLLLCIILGFRQGIFRFKLPRAPYWVVFPSANVDLFTIVRVHFNLNSISSVDMVNRIRHESGSEKLIAALYVCALAVRDASHIFWGGQYQQH